MGSQTARFVPRTVLFKGRKVLAEYQDPVIPDYRGNPAIEALPPIYGPEEAMTRLKYYPEYNDRDRDLAPHLRLHLVRNVMRFFAPQAIHLDLEQRISCLIRQGLLPRNPAASWYWKDMESGIGSLCAEVPPVTQTLPVGFGITGVSGSGKTLAIRSALNLYPQVIHHSCYQGWERTYSQLVWLILECPFDGSIKALCHSFFQAVDDILLTTYYDKYAPNGATVNRMIPAMGRVAALHILGALVIDEIQRLSAVKNDNASNMLDFFAQLSNEIGVPVILVGTQKATTLLGSKFILAKRISLQGEMTFERMKQDETWDFFVEQLGKYQYLRQRTELKGGLSDTLYEVSQGIPCVASLAYMLAQVRSINGGKEKMTSGLIESVVKEELPSVHKILLTARSGGRLDIDKFDEAFSRIDVEALIEGLARRQRINLTPKAQGEANGDSDKYANGTLESVAESLVQAGVDIQLSKELAKRAIDICGSVADIREVRQQAFALWKKNSASDQQSDNTDKKPKAKKTRKREKVLQEGSLQEVVTSAKKRGVAPYQALNEVSTIRPASEFLEGEVMG